MDGIVDLLAAQQAALAALVAPLDRDGLVRPSRCPGWTIADVLLHLAQTNELAVASLDGSFDAAVTALAAGAAAATTVDGWAAATVDAQRPADPTESADRWLTSAGAQVAAFGAADPSARVPWVSGLLAARTLAATRLAETWIHHVDIASPLGATVPPGEHLRPIARLAWRTLPHAFARVGDELHGPVAFELTAPDGSRWDFVPDEPPARAVVTVVRGPAADLCEVAGQRARAAGTALVAEGPDAEAVLRLVRTFA